MSADAFLDTCVVAYAFVEGDVRQERSLEILADGGTISVQVLNELANICRRKLALDWAGTEGALEAVKVCCPRPVPLTQAVHEAGVRLARRYGFSVYDGLILAAAVDAGCTTLLTEDLQHGQVVEGVRIENPFHSTR
ncbi:MAG: PIN domain-containing protein [Terracidiphilus sp.]|nr:PIN domain-containing protein [Terracidiphilus sp.]